MKKIFLSVLGSIALAVLSVTSYAAPALDLNQGGACRIPAGEYPVGTLTVDELLDEADLFYRRYQAASSDSDDIALMRAVDAPVKVEVIMGVWCSDSQRYVPKIIKLLEEANNPNIQMSMYALDANKEDPFHYWEIRNIKRVPTIILYRDGEELGRIVERTEQSLGKDMARIMDNESAPLCLGACGKPR